MRKPINHIFIFLALINSCWVYTQSVSYHAFIPSIVSTSVNETIQDDRDVDILQDGTIDLVTSFAEVAGEWRMAFKCQHDDIELLYERNNSGAFNYVSGIMPGNFINVDSVFESSLLLVGDRANPNIANLGEQYIGFRIRIEGLWHYGWLRLELIRDNVSKLILKSYTFNNRAGAPILSSEGDPNPIIKIRDLEITQKYKVFQVALGSTLQLRGDIFPENVDLPTLKWSIESLGGQASINQQGLLVPQSAGKVLVRIESLDGSQVGATKEILILEDPIQASDIALESPNDTLLVDATMQLSATVFPSNTTNFAVEYSLSDESVASVGTFGLLQGLSEGLVTIYAKTLDGTALVDSLTVYIEKPKILVQSISIKGRDDISTVQVSQQLYLEATILPANAANQNLEWFVENRSGQAEINQAGVLTGVTAGFVRVFAKAADNSGIQGEVFIQVVEQDILPNKVEIIQPNYQIAAGLNAEIPFKAFVSPHNVTDTSVHWSVNTLTGNADINNLGELFTTAVGKVEIIASAQANSNIRDTYQFSVLDPLYPVSNIIVTTDDNLSVFYPNTSIQLQAIIHPASASIQEVYWTIDNIEGEAAIDQSGILRAVKAGKVRIIAHARDGSGRQGVLEIDIPQSPFVPVERILIDNPTYSNVVFIGNSVNFTANIYPENASNKDFVWKLIEETGKATMDQSGRFYPLRTGWVTVMAITKDGSGLYDLYSVYVQNREVPIYSIRINTIDGVDSVSLTEGAMQMRAYLLPTNVSNKEVKWTVINGTGSGTISSEGLFQPESVGTVQVKGTSVSNPEYFDVMALRIYEIQSNDTTNVSVSNESFTNNRPKVYPNPTRQMLRIKHDWPLQYLKLMDSRGALILERRNPKELELQLTDIQTGVYYLVFKDLAGNHFIQKVIRL